MNLQALAAKAWVSAEWLNKGLQLDLAVACVKMPSQLSACRRDGKLSSVVTLAKPLAALVKKAGAASDIRVLIVKGWSDNCGMKVKHGAGKTIFCQWFEQLRGIIWLKNY